MALAAIHDGNSPVGGQSLRHMRVEGISEVESGKHWIAQLKHMIDRCGGGDRDRLAVDRGDPGLIRIEQASLMVGIGPADLVPRMEVEPLFLEQPQRILLGPGLDLSGPEDMVATIETAQYDARCAAVRPLDHIAAGSQALSALVAIEHQYLARHV